MHIALSARTLAPHRGQESGLTSLRGSLTFLCTPVCVVCRALAVGLLAFGAEASDGPRPTPRTRLPSGPQRRPPSSPWARATGAARARPRARRRWHPSAARGSPSPSARRTPRASAAPRPGLATRGPQPPAPGSLDHELHPLRFGRPSSSPSSSLFSTRHVSSCRERLLTCRAKFQ